ncbi:Ferrochelatase [Rhodovastum atsumiense]|uniref:Ferrochelatase n=1 Tax=Rhodovastum atsumiense TaxID=504468 RepID=A0A5M6J1V8_9PROT|nr:ferrochelatase [Rhodovastum atsumiense]KAA5614582.1 ferrochelatase [Rhodovastum atsumiense]CAH2599923.1 Ferrochelatase [Rhodovastum atsumiense]
MSHLTRQTLRPALPSWSSRFARANGRIGVLLVNLGTPDAPGYRAVRRYLSEFLSDRRVIEAHPLLWQPLLQGMILATRPFRTGAAYRAIWRNDTDESPLRSFTRAQATQLAVRWPASSGIVVDWAMRYGRPSIAERLETLTAQGCDRILVVPLYPQYSATTTASVNDAVFRALMRMRRQPAVRTTPSFPDHPLYVAAVAERIRTTLGRLDWTPELLIGSFHGLPRRYVQAGDPYPAECGRTMAALRRDLGLSPRQFPMTFQSRFGRDRWLEPATEARVATLAARGVKRLAVVAPGFLADCVETLEELGCGLRETFLRAGGERFCLVPCLNDEAGITALLDDILRNGIAGWIDGNTVLPPGSGQTGHVSPSHWRPSRTSSASAPAGPSLPAA